jgi:tetratricopeptide (TPR) repeat protein
MRLFISLFILSWFCCTATASKDYEKIIRETPSDSVEKLILLKNEYLSYIKQEYDIKNSYEVFNQAGLLYYSKNLPHFAEIFFYEALLAAEISGDSERQGEMLSNIGVMREIQGDFAGALKQYQEALQLFIKTDNIKSQSLVYNNIAVMHQELGNQDLAYVNLHKSYSLKLLTGDESLTASALNNLGVYHDEVTGINDSALHYYKKAHDIYVNLNNNANIAISQGNMAIIHIRTGNFEIARDLLDKAIDYYSNNNDNRGLSKALLYYSNLEIAENKDYHKALEMLKESRELIYNTSHVRDIILISTALAEAYYNTGMYKDGIDEIFYYQSLKDSLLNLDRQKEIKKLEIMFQSAQKEFEIESLQKEADLQREVYARKISYIIALVLILSLIILILLLRIRHKKLFMENKNIQLKQDLLQKQMNPHFLFNVLTSIQSFINRSDTEAASKYISKFSGLVRNVLISSSSEYVSLNDEIGLLNSYINLQQLRLNHSFDYKIDIEKIEDLDDISIPPMMIQPFVENAIIHGLKDIDQAYLQIKIREKHFENDLFIIFEISDNGVGIENRNTHSKHKSMALSILKQRCEILEQKWNKKISFTYLPVEIGTKVEVSLPFV